jgi:hypothetical protein
MFSLLLSLIDVFADGFNAALNTKFGQYKGQLVAVLRQGIYGHKLWHTDPQFNRFVP